MISFPSLRKKSGEINSPRAHPLAGRRSDQLPKFPVADQACGTFRSVVFRPSRFPWVYFILSFPGFQRHLFSIVFFSYRRTQ
jgi:hypothetical protein